MGNTRIATTDRSGLTLAQVGGNDIYKMLPQVQSVIELGQLGEDYALLFSEPVENGRMIDWYSERDGRPVQAISLPPEERKEVLTQLRQMLEKLHEYSISLRAQTSNQTYRNYADIIEKAVTLPDVDSIYAIDGKPILVNWGFSQGDNDFVDGTKKLIKELEDKINDTNGYIDKEMSQAKSEPENDSANKPETEESPPPQTEPLQEEGETQTPPDSAPAPDETSAPGEGDVGEPAVSQPVSGSSYSWLPAVLTGGALVLAGAAAAWYFLLYKPAHEAAEPTTSLGWLKGTLQARGVMVDENNQPVNLSLSFAGEDGKGTAYIVEKNQTCEGKVTAAMQPENKVLFSIDQLECPNQNHYSPFSMLCTRGADTCTGTNQNGENWHIEVNMGGRQ